MVEPLRLRVGQVVVGRWDVMEQLRDGGFGVGVYKVRDMNGGQLYTLKTEGADEQVNSLKKEVSVLDELEAVDCIHARHIEDRGRTGAFFFVVMTLLGATLHDVRKALQPQRFTAGTALRVGLQCLEALEDLHSVGVLLRNVSPRSFTIGREEIGEQRVIYVLDFGMHRRFVDEFGRVRPPRAAAAFCGSVRFASVNSHELRELSRVDDLECLFYTLVELSTGSLPWRHVLHRDEVGRCKRSLRDFGADFYALVRRCPFAYMVIFRYIVALRFFDEPDYAVVSAALRSGMAEVGARSRHLFDWQRPLPAHGP